MLHTRKLIETDTMDTWKRRDSISHKIHVTGIFTFIHHLKKQPLM